MADNPYLNFLESLGGSHSTLKKLASTSTPRTTTAPSSSSISNLHSRHPSSTSSSARPSSSASTAPRPVGQSSSDRPYSSSSSKHGSASRPSSYSHSSSSSSSKQRSYDRYDRHDRNDRYDRHDRYDRDDRDDRRRQEQSHGHSKSLSHSSVSSSSRMNIDRHDSKPRHLHQHQQQPHPNDRRPVSNDYHHSNSSSRNSTKTTMATTHQRQESRESESAKSPTRDERISSSGQNKSPVTNNNRKRERHAEVEPLSSSSLIRDPSVATKTDGPESLPDARAVKRHARSRTWSRSPSRSRSRSRSTSRDRNTGKNMGISRGPVSASVAASVPLEVASTHHSRPTTPPPPVPLPLPLLPPRPPSTPPHQQRDFLDFDDTSSLSTLSSPSSFSSSPTPRSMPSSPVRRPDLSPLHRTKMTESIVPAQASPASFSSTSSLSSPSPDRSNRTSPDPESGLGLNSVGPSPYSSTPSELDSVADSPNPLDKKQNLKESGQGNLVLELFGALSKPKTVAIDTRGLQDEKKRLKKPVELDDDEAFLGTVPPQPNTISKPASKKKPGLTNGKRVSPNDTLSREIVVINPTKGSVSTRTIDVPSKPKVAQSNGKASGAKSGSASASPSKPTTSSLSKKLATATDSGATSTSTSNGSAIPRRMSLLHSDQIVAAAMGRYKNHFHMLVEDSDSTVASNPSSTGGDTMHVSLEYPGKDSREKFTLMKPFLSRSKAESDDKDEYNPIEDLIQTVRTIMEYFFTPEQYKELFGSQNEGLYRSLTKYKVRKDGAQFMKAVEEFNTIMRKQKASGAIESHIKQYGHRLPYDLVVHILGQVYSRTVAARASKLNNYEAFSNNVYGEILPILTKEFIQRAKLDHTKVFVDLGCGIGNVVLQVALQTGAESYGVEIMDTPAKFAKKQASEFEARSRAYGLNHGSVKMIKGDFLDTPELVGILARADVVLVNNYAFNSALNQSLLQLFLDLKEGCKIISLKTFVPLDHKINVRNAGSVESILRVKKYPYYTNAVSWTHNGGEYFVATVDRAPVQAFYERGVYDDGGGRRSSSRRH